MNNYNINNCRSTVRAFYNNKWGELFTLCGIHGKTWSIIKENTDGSITKFNYPNRVAAKKAFTFMTVTQDRMV